MTSKGPTDEGSAATTPKEKPKKKRRSPAVPWKKPKDMPRRPLSAYNLFFRQEREKMLREGWKTRNERASTAEHLKADQSKTGGFANLARTVASKWKDLPAEEKAPFEQEAAKEKARYDSQMLCWRAEQEQKKSRKVSGSTSVREASKNRTNFEIYAAHLEGIDLMQSDYPEDWFQADNVEMSNEANAAMQRNLFNRQNNIALSAQLYQQRQQQQLQQQQQQQSQQYLQANPMVQRLMYTPVFTNPLLQTLDPNLIDSQRRFLQQQRASGVSLQVDSDSSKQNRVEQEANIGMWAQSQRSQMMPQALSLTLRSEGNSAIPPGMDQTRMTIGGLAPSGFLPQYQSLGEESSMTAGILQQAFFGNSSFFEKQTQSVGEGIGQTTRVVHRSSIGVSPGYNPPLRRSESTQRLPRSQSFPDFALSPNTQGQLKTTGLEPSAATASQSRTQNLSPHTTANSMMKLPNMFPTPPQQINKSANGTNTTSLSMNAPRLPSDEELQSVDSPLRLSGRRHLVPHIPNQELANSIANDIGLCDDMSNASDEQDHQRSSLFQSTFEDSSSIAYDGTNLLSNLKFDGHQAEE